MAERSKSKYAEATPPTVDADREAPPVGGDKPVPDAPKAAEPSPAAPLEAPVSKAAETAGAADTTAPNAVSPARNNTVRLLSADGSEVEVDDIFTYPTMSNPGALVHVNQRVYREYSHPGTATRLTQLMYPVGAAITIFEAERIKSEIKDAQAAAVPPE